MQDLENLDINQKQIVRMGRIRTVKILSLRTLDERIEKDRRLFTIGAKSMGVIIAEARAYNKKDASQVAAQIAVEKNWDYYEIRNHWKR